MSHTVTGFTTPDGNPLAVHQVMFVPTLMNQADEEQVSRWLGDVFNGNIIGTYAQVRGRRQDRHRPVSHCRPFLEFRRRRDQLMSADIDTVVITTDPAGPVMLAKNSVR